MCEPVLAMLRRKRKAVMVSAHRGICSLKTFLCLGATDRFTGSFLYNRCCQEDHDSANIYRCHLPSPLDFYTFSSADVVGLTYWGQRNGNYFAMISKTKASGLITDHCNWSDTAWQLATSPRGEWDNCTKRVKT